jgi:hypothetical protein
LASKVHDVLKVASHLFKTNACDVRRSWLARTGRSWEEPALMQGISSRLGTLGYTCSRLYSRRASHPHCQLVSIIGRSPNCDPTTTTVTVEPTTPPTSEIRAFDHLPLRQCRRSSASRGSPLCTCHGSRVTGPAPVPTMHKAASQPSSSIVRSLAQSGDIRDFGTCGFA